MVSPLKGLLLTLYFFLSKQVHRGLIGTGGRRDRATYLLPQSITTRSWTKILFDRAVLSCSHFYDTEASALILAHPFRLVTKSKPMRYLLSKPDLSSRIARWLLQLSEFNITIINPTGIRSQALADLLAQFSAGEHKPLCEDLPCEKVSLVEEVEWRPALMAPPLIKAWGGGGRSYTAKRRWHCRFSIF